MEQTRLALNELPLLFKLLLMNVMLREVALLLSPREYIHLGPSNSNPMFVSTQSQIV